MTGPGDGRPFHYEFLRAAWGRDPGSAGGDVLGFARWWEVGAATAETERVVVQAYRATSVPEVVLAWFRREFPGADVCAVSGAA